MTDRPLLSISGLEVTFGGFRALQGVDFEACAGEIHFLIGPNGAGKTTLVDVVTGLTKPSEGSVRFGATELVGRREHEIVRLGVGRTFQTATVFEQLTVTENLDLARSFRMRLPRLLRRRHGTGLEVAKALNTIGLGARGDALAGGLSHGEKQWLEIGMLLAQDPKLLLVDEPVAGMTDAETEATAELLKRISAADHSVVVVEHDMAFVRALGVKVTCLHEGSVLAEGAIDVVSENPRVVEVYLGR